MIEESDQHLKDIEAVLKVNITQIRASLFVCVSRGHIWRLFRLLLHFISCGGRSAHLAYHVHKSGCETAIIVIMFIVYDLSCAKDCWYVYNWLMIFYLWSRMIAVTWCWTALWMSARRFSTPIWMIWNGKVRHLLQRPPSPLGAAQSLSKLPGERATRYLVGTVPGCTRHLIIVMMCV